MFSSDIVSSDIFIELEPSTQCLYFQYGMKADDDGFFNPQIIMRMIGATKKDLDKLLEKRFILQFPSGICVIKHWRINNFIRKDRYKQTTYLDERKLLFVKDNNSYTLDKSQGVPFEKAIWKSDEDKRKVVVNTGLNLGQPNDIPLVNPSKVKLSKDKLLSTGATETPTKKITSKITPKFQKPTVAEVREYCKERNNKIDPQAFIDKYDSIGWVVGKARTPMKDWRATIRTWENYLKEHGSSKGQALHTPQSDAIVDKMKNKIIKA